MYPPIRPSISVEAKQTRVRTNATGFPRRSGQIMKNKRQADTYEFLACEPRSQPTRISVDNQREICFYFICGII